MTAQGKGDKRSQVKKGCISLFFKSFCKGTSQTHLSCSWQSSHLGVKSQGAMPSNHSNPCRLPGVSKFHGSFSVDFPVHLPKPVTESSFSNPSPTLALQSNCPFLLSSVVPYWLPRTMLSSGDVEVLLCRLSGLSSEIMTNLLSDWLRHSIADRKGQWDMLLLHGSELMTCFYLCDYFSWNIHFKCYIKKKASLTFAHHHCLCCPTAPARSHIHCAENTVGLCRGWALLLKKPSRCGLLRGGKGGHSTAPFPCPSASSGWWDLWLLQPLASSRRLQEWTKLKVPSGLHLPRSRNLEHIPKTQQQRKSQSNPTLKLNPFRTIWR